MRIAQVAPLYAAVPPVLCGGSERMIAYLTDALVDQGHEVTLFASGDSSTRARLVAPCARALGVEYRMDAIPLHLAMLEEVYRRAHEFDVIHFHLEALHLPAMRRLHLPHLTTLHGRLDFEHVPDLYVEFSELPVVSLSRSQRAPLVQANWVGNVYHGIPKDLHHLGRGGDYLVFIGRVSPERRLDRAIAIAEQAGMKLRVAAKVDRDLQSLLGRDHVEFLGELDEQHKGELIRNACALIHPVDPPEPDGLVMIEALACGTPVIAFRNGCVPEIIDDGVTGFLVDTIDEAVVAISMARKLARGEIRAVFEQRFTSARMASDYAAVYATVRDVPAAAAVDLGSIDRLTRTRRTASSSQ